MTSRKSPQLIGSRIKKDGVLGDFYKHFNPKEWKLFSRELNNHLNKSLYKTLRHTWLNSNW